MSSLNQVLAIADQIATDGESNVRTETSTGADININATRATATPINLTNPNKLGMKAKIDYLREQRHFGEDSKFFPKWDDSRYNNTQVGDPFMFVQNGANIAEKGWRGETRTDAEPERRKRNTG